MPRVALTDKQKFSQQRIYVSEECDVLLTRSKVAKKQIAEYMGLTVRSIQYQFEKKQITLETALAVFYLTQASDSDIARIMRMKW